MSKLISDVKSTTHRTAPDVPVQARAIIGNGQLGGWAMLLGTEFKAGGSGNQWVQLGTGADLKGHHLEVSASIQDMNQQTNRLSLLVEISGPETTTLTIAHDGEAGGRAAYSAFIIFE